MGEKMRFYSRFLWGRYFHSTLFRGAFLFTMICGPIWGDSSQKELSQPMEEDRSSQVLLRKKPAVSQEGVSLFERRGLIYTGVLAVNLFANTTNSVSNNRISFLGGLASEYFFVPSVGVFLGGQLTSRGFIDATNNNSSSALYIDIPAGLAFNASFFGTYSRRFQVLLGPYYSIPLSQFQGTVPLLVGTNKNQPFLGIYFASEALFEVTESFDLGYIIYFKYGIQSAIPAQTVNFSEFGIGVEAALF